MTPEDQIRDLNAAQARWTEWVKAEAESKVALATRSAELKFASSNVKTAKADATLTFVGIKGHLFADVVFGDGKKMHFDAWPWGVGAGGGRGIGVYFGVPADALAGACLYHCTFAGQVGGGIKITCWRYGVGVLGVIIVAGLAAGAGEFGGGDGSWTHA